MVYVLVESHDIDFIFKSKSWIKNYTIRQLLTKKTEPEKTFDWLENETFVLNHFAGKFMMCVLS